MSNPDLQILADRTTHTLRFRNLVLRAETAGTILLTSSDPLKPVQVQMPHLVDNDVKKLAWAVEFLRRLVTVSPLKEMVESEVYPGSNFTGPALEAFIKEQGSLGWIHYEASCPMGEVNDPNAVVDPKLHVKKVTNLRIGDSSVLRDTGCGNPHATVLMIAEKCSDLIFEKSKVS